MSFVGNFVRATIGLMKGLGITGKNFLRTVALRQAMTITEKWGSRKIADRYRGIVALTTDLQTGKENCVGCMACMRVCPGHCIYIEVERREGHHGRYPVKFFVDLSLCSFCGLCVEVCPTPSLIHSHVWQFGGYSRSQLLLGKGQLLNWGDEEQTRRGDAELITGKRSQQRRAKKTDDKQAE
ncbi:MAG: 4Fe-4S binding protein [Armatimonadota bacterium]|nr:4Fe-4S binding protein [Armatimonadota bacterium]MCX7777378.1 4Fe-4S binding protein [Armatimonadota bacterium]MDW8025354.1 4Fe-4S binding protein [Armatimonadota bacterium]